MTPEIETFLDGMLPESPLVGLTGGLKRVSLRPYFEGTRSGHFARNH